MSESIKVARQLIDLRNPYRLAASFCGDIAGKFQPILGTIESVRLGRKKEKLDFGFKTIKP